MKYPHPKRIIGLLAVLALAFSSAAWAQKPQAMVQYLEDQHSRNQDLEHTRNLSLEIKLTLIKAAKPDHYRIESLIVETAQGQEVLSRTDGSEVYVVRTAKAELKDQQDTIRLWRDPLTKKVVAITMPLLDLRVTWEGPWGDEPDDKLVLGPVSMSEEKGAAPENQPAQPDHPGLPKWLLEAGVHPDFAVDTCPDEVTYLGGGAWLREEPELVWEKTYSWEVVLPN